MLGPIHKSDKKKIEKRLRIILENFYSQSFLLFTVSNFNILKDNSLQIYVNILNLLFNFNSILTRFM